MLRATKKRLEVLKNLKKISGFISAQNLSIRTKDVDKATVYRALDLFVKEGTVRKVLMDNGEALYEFIANDHHHLICDDCNIVEHINIPRSKLAKIIDMSHFEEGSIDVVIRGKCRKLNKSK